LEADSIVARVRVRVSGLVGEQVDGSHSQEPPSTLRPGDVDGVADTPVPQPAGVAHVHAILPGQVKLSGGGESGTEFSALTSCFVEGKLLDRHGVEDPSWEESGEQKGDKHVDSPQSCPHYRRFRIAGIALVAIPFVRRMYL